MPRMGFEPTHLAAYASETYMSTIPSPGHTARYTYTNRRHKWFLFLYSKVELSLKKFHSCLCNCMCLSCDVRLVPRTGIEPVLPIGKRILSPPCLPFHHLGKYTLPPDYKTFLSFAIKKSHRRRWERNFHGARRGTWTLTPRGNGF